MSDPIKERTRAETEAARWFTRLSQPSVTHGVLEEFREWRRNPQNAQAYAKVGATWDTAGGLAHEPEIRAATLEALKRREPRPHADPRPGRAGPYRLGGAILAALALAAAVGFFALKQPSYTTKVGEQRLVVLADGSRVRLNTDSQVYVRYRPGERRLILTRGEAFFDVAHNSARPFVVEANGAQVRALGTKFDVRRDAGQVRVTLVEGRVEVRHDDRPQVATLAPNQQLTVTAQGVSQPRQTNAAEAAGWTTGRLTFHEMALADAIAEVNRYAPRKITLDAPLGDKPVSGVFDAGDTEAFVAAVTTLFGLKADASNNVIRLSAPAPGADG